MVEIRRSDHVDIGNRQYTKEFNTVKMLGCLAALKNGHPPREDADPDIRGRSWCLIVKVMLSYFYVC